MGMRREAEDGTGAVADRPPGSLLMKVPGRARPASLALKEFEQGVADLKKRMNPIFWSLFIREADSMYRWRMQLECGCTREILTAGKDRFPDQGSSRYHSGKCDLPAGEYWCSTTHDGPKIYRDIVEWVEREVKEFPPDPVEPQHGLDPEAWAEIRHQEPHSSAFWLVRLACGHLHEHVVTDVDWKPEDGPKLVTAERAAEMRREYEELFAERGPDSWPRVGSERDHFLKMLDLRAPRPEPEQECYACTHAKRVTGYQRIGWLVPRPKPTPPPPTRRQVVAAQLAKAEAEVQRLRRELEESSG